MEYLKLIRYKNLIFIALMQLLIHGAVIMPILNVYGINAFIPYWLVGLLILSTVLISAGGYVINDYFDVKIDRMNKPENLIITKSIQKHEAMRFYQIMTAMGVVSGLVSAIVLRSITLGFICIVVPGMLWFYSASYKRQLIIGDLIVAISASIIPLIPLIAGARNLELIYGSILLQQTPILRHLYIVVCSYSAFIFIFTLIDKIINDLEDEAGDREMECHTMAVVWGDKVSKIIVSLLILFANIGLFWIVSSLHFEGSMSMRYYIFGIFLPSVCMLIVLCGKSCSAYKNASSLTKFIMIIGVLYSIIYCYLLCKQYSIPMFGVFQIV